MNAACLVVVLSVLGGTEGFLAVQVSVEKERYFRGSRSTVQDLDVSVTVTNLSDAGALRIATPSVGLLRGTQLTVLFHRPAFGKWKLEPLFPWFKSGEEMTELDVDELVRIVESGKLPSKAMGEQELAEVSQAMQELLPAYFKRSTDVDNADLGEIERRIRAGEGPFLVGRRVRETLRARAGEAAVSAIPPGGALSFDLDIGRYFDFYDGGKYGVACSILGVESNTAEFEVLPVMRTDLRADEIIGRLVDLENGPPRYEAMFYLCRSSFAWDEVVYVRRHVPAFTSRLKKATRGVGGLRFEGLSTQWPNCPWPQPPAYELDRVCKFKPGTTPKVMVSGRKAAFLIEDPLALVHWLYTVDFSTTPARIERREAGEGGGPEPSLTVDHQGQFQVM